MAPRAFDRKFGADRLTTLTTGPGVYLFRDADDRVLYVGKAKNLRRRLQGYRNASRKRVHRKMRILVREASALEVRPQASEQDALLTENTLIQTLRPPYNIDGAYAFLYPAVGLAAPHDDAHPSAGGRQTLLAFTTDPDAWSALGLRWYGVFRSRPRVKAGFDALTDLLCMLGHREPRTRLPPRTPVRGARLVAIRQLPRPLVDALHGLLAGEDRGALSLLSAALLDKPRALREASEVQEHLHAIDAFFHEDCARLHAALRALDKKGHFVPQDERDALFIRARG